MGKNNKRKTQEEFIKEVSNINESIEVLGEYINIHTPILSKCKIHDIIWKPHPTSLLKGCGCEQCKAEKIASKLSLSVDEFVLRIKQTNPNIIVLGNYVNNFTKISCKCLIDKHIWEPLPLNLLKGEGCPICAQRYKDNNMFLKQLALINNQVLPLEEYKTAHTKIKCKCLTCNNVFLIMPSKLLIGQSCPSCSSKSNLENIINNFLKINDIQYTRNMKYFDLRGVKGGLLSYDFFLPTYNLLIEAQGEQHEHPVERFGGEKQFIIQQEHDNRKRNYAHVNKIELLEIWYWDINRINDILIHKLQLNNT